jgi:hypothetical protein
VRYAVTFRAIVEVEATDPAEAADRARSLLPDAKFLRVGTVIEAPPVRDEDEPLEPKPLPYVNRAHWRDERPLRKEMKRD